MKIVTAAQMAALEQAAARRGISIDTQMERAGLAVADAAREALGGAAGIQVIVLVGPGNNGSDGLVTARHLQRWGADVTAYLVMPRASPDPKLDLARRYGVTVTGCADDLGLESLRRLLARSRLVIDAVLGTGRSRPLEDAAKQVMSCVAASRASPRHPLLLAVDLPTGLNSDTGEVDPACPTMDVTVALGYPKIGLLTFPGAERVGHLRVADIGLPPDLEEENTISLELLTPEWVAHHLPARPLNSHKGTFGHALVVAGSRDYTGAAYLASQAAIRVGTGLVTLATPRSVYPIAAGKLTEAIHLPLPEDRNGRVHPDGAQLIRERLPQHSAMLLGCGLGCSSGTSDFLERLLLREPRPTLPMVIDADGLNNLSRLRDWWQRLGGPVALTPHPGEMATLTGSTIMEVQKDRIAMATRWSTHWNATVVLKGAHTIIAEPGGMARVSPFANPGLASGGTGDVLTGIIGGLMAQGLSPYVACCCGVYLHGLAGETVRQAKGDTGAIASDLIERLPETISRLRRETQTIEEQ